MSARVFQGYIYSLDFFTKKYGFFKGLKRFLLKFPDLFYDIINGTDTFFPIPLENLIIKENVVDSTDYQSTNIWQIKKLFVNSFVENPRNHIFLDIGCGKGKVLLEAAKHGFKKCIGIDFSDDLCRIARRNSRVFRNGIYRDKIMIIRKDARNYKFDNGENVLFTFNPFGASSLEIMLNNLYDSFINNPRELLVFCYSSKYDLSKIHDSLTEVKESNIKIKNGKCYSFITR